MTQTEVQQIDKYNRLCAEFLGWYQEKGYWKKIRPSDSCLIKDAAICHEYELRFHSDWNWIMEVVEAIDRLGYVTKIVDTGMCIEGKLNLERWGETKKEGVVETIQQFILWHNENKKQTNNI